MNQTMELSPMRNYILLATLGLSLAASAQTINFENTDYKGLGVYDTWEASPFRTGALEGNYAVVDNHLTAVEEMLGEAPNPSQKLNTKFSAIWKPLLNILKQHPSPPLSKRTVLLSEKA